jgi:hypothetical protein
MKNFPEEVCSRESWLYLIFSYRGTLTVGFGLVAAANPGTRATRRPLALTRGDLTVGPIVPRPVTGALRPPPPRGTHGIRPAQQYARVAFCHTGAPVSHEGSCERSVPPQAGPQARTMGHSRFPCDRAVDPSHHGAVPPICTRGASARPRAGTRFASHGLCRC